MGEQEGEAGGSFIWRELTKDTTDLEFYWDNVQVGGRR